ncbi:MFS transporter [Acidisoma cellulosilyticum]|uniref:MFS transporter n=1 Tax=Acidisoma cellulosilyticum TaxID=2802395 RepID=UPI001D09A8EE|nr:MFS transporter [Acidisoma cellulosilyticum]
MTSPPAAPISLGASEHASAEPVGLSKAIVFLFALACGATTANVYYAQSIAGPIADSLHLPRSLAGLIVTTTQLGYGLGLFFLVSLSDLVENRRLVLMTTSGTVLSLVWVAISLSAPSFLAASLVLGICAVGSQILVPLAVHLSPEKQRGQVIGSIMGGLVTGIMLSRPLASFLAAQLGWRAIFVLSAAIMLSVLLLLARSLPAWKPHPSRGYLMTLLSTLRLLATVRTLQRRAAYQGTLFAVFNLFWTGVPLMLHTRFGLGKIGIAAFALAGAAGALAAPIAGRVADKGGSTIGTGVVLLGSAIALLISGWGQAAGSILILVAAALILDGAVQANQVFGQRIVQSIDPRARGRLNAAYMTVVFLCGAAGSALGSLTYYHGGWWLTASVGALMALGIFLVFLTESPRSRLPVR